MYQHNQAVKACASFSLRVPSTLSFNYIQFCEKPTMTEARDETKFK